MSKFDPKKYICLCVDSTGKPGGASLEKSPAGLVAPPGDKVPKESLESKPKNTMLVITITENEDILAAVKEQGVDSQPVTTPQEISHTIAAPDSWKNANLHSISASECRNEVLRHRNEQRSTSCIDFRNSYSSRTMISTQLDNKLQKDSGLLSSHSSATFTKGGKVQSPEKDRNGSPSCKVHAAEDADDSSTFHSYQQIISLQTDVVSTTVDSVDSLNNEDAEQPSVMTDDEKWFQILLFQLHS